MNRQHLQAFIWLRWRLRVNQVRRSGKTNAILLAILACLAIVLAAVLFVGSLCVGWFSLPAVPALTLLYVWDAIIVVFLFSWVMGLVNDLQRSEVLSLEKFLHLPVSLSSAFFVNYVSSLLSFHMLVFLPAMIGLSLGLVLGRGPLMLLLLPLVAAFILMVTALTHQFQGWLAALMVNKRRRRTVIVLATALVILIAQLPNLVFNVWQPQKRAHPDDRSSRLLEQHRELDRELAAGKLTPEQYQRRMKEITEEHRVRTQVTNEKTGKQFEQTVWLINLCLPPGWLPLGVMALGQGEVLPALLATLGLAGIGLASLSRSYRTTLKLYKGQFTSGSKRAAGAARVADKDGPALSGAAPAGPNRSATLLERKLPFLSEQAAVIALSGLRSFTRAPEAKMMLLSPFLLMVIFGSMVLTRRVEPPEFMRPLMAYGAMTMALLSMGQPLVNQFGFDRGGFRVFVLCAAPRRDILLGKNLAPAPLAFGMSLAVTIVIEVMYPMRLEHLLSVVPQFVAMYLVVCLMANCLSILTPMAIAPDSLRPANVKAIPLLLQLLFTFLFPLVLLPTLLPLGVEFLLAELGWSAAIPVCLLLTLVECALVMAVYHLVLLWQGAWLQSRELKILEIVTARPE